MRRKVAKISLLVISLMISLTIPIIAVTAKKKEWIRSPILIDEYGIGLPGLPGLPWADYADEPWLKGSGTEEDPYMIKNLVIDAGGNFFCMMIMNSEAYFKIMDCTFSNTSPGPDAGRNAALILIGTQNGVIFKNEIFGCGIPGTGQGSGIALIASHNNKIQKNLCHDNAGPGIYLQYSNDNVIRQNLCKGNQWGIMIAEWSNYNEITKNKCYDNYADGILLWGESNSNMITKNKCKGNLHGGITVSGSYGNVITENECHDNQQGIILSYGASFNEVINNICYENLGSGISVISGWGNVITDNECNDNSVAGIYLIYSGDNVITENLCKRNQWGIYIGDWSSYNEVTNNDCSNNIETGIHLFYYADYNVITNNDCKENFGSGITLSTSNGNIITHNNCSNNGENGIFLVDWYDPMRMVNQTANNILYRNYIENNLNGIHFLEADKNDVFRNMIKENDIGILVEEQSAHNLIYQNNFIDNGVHASNEHAGLNNWHSIYMLEGNYWSGYTGTDSDGDGIGDTPWPWPDFDVYPFMEENGWEILTPIEEEILNARADPDTNRLGWGLDYRANEEGYLIVGAGQLFSERTQDTWNPPYTCRLWFFGIEYGFEGNIWHFEWSLYYQEPVWANLFYLRIPANIFTDMGLPLGVLLNYQWSVSFYSGGVKQYMNITSYFTLI